MPGAHGLFDLTLARASTRLETLACRCLRRTTFVTGRRYAHQSVSPESVPPSEYVLLDQQADRSFYSRYVLELDLFLMSGEFRWRLPFVHVALLSSYVGASRILSLTPPMVAELVAHSRRQAITGARTCIRSAHLLGSNPSTLRFLCAFYVESAWGGSETVAMSVVVYAAAPIWRTRRAEVGRKSAENITTPVSKPLSWCIWTV